MASATSGHYSRHKKPSLTEHVRSYRYESTRVHHRGFLNLMRMTYGESMAKCEDGKGGGRIRHELAGMAVGVAVLVHGTGSPGARGRLMAFEPIQTLGDLRVILGYAGALENVQGETRGVSVRRRLLGRPVAPLPIPELWQTPAAVRLLFLKQLSDELLLLGFC